MLDREAPRRPHSPSRQRCTRTSLAIDKTSRLFATFSHRAESGRERAGRGTRGEPTLAASFEIDDVAAIASASTRGISRERKRSRACKLRTMTTSPHDALFKHVFSQVEHASGELRSVLPPGLVARIDFATLRACPGSFVDETLADRHADLLFSVELSGRPAFVYLLMEHQSTVDPLMPFRVLRYVVRIWDAYLADHPDAERLPAIVPVVVHHSETGWTGAVAVEQLLDVDEGTLADAGPHLPRLRFVLDDLGSASDEALQARAMTALGRLVLWCLRDARRHGEILRRLDRWGETMREVLRAPTGVAALSAVLRYLLEVADVPIDELRAAVVARVGDEVKEAMATTAEKLRKEGRDEGRVEGRVEALRAVLLRLVRGRFGDVPVPVADRIASASAEQLEAWTDRVLVAATPSEIVSDT